MQLQYKLQISEGALKVHLVFALIVFSISGCKKFVQIDPPTTQITASTVYSDNTSAAAAMTGIYSNMMMNPSSNFPVVI